MDKYELQNRTKQFAVRVINLSREFPVNMESKIILNQIVRSSTSVAANYRASCRAKSAKDFISKMTTVEEECDETLFWLEMIEEVSMVPGLEKDIQWLKKEASELLSIVIASVKTTRKNLNNRQ